MIKIFKQKRQEGIKNKINDLTMLLYQQTNNKGVNNKDVNLPDFIVFNECKKQAIRQVIK